MKFKRFLQTALLLILAASVAGCGFVRVNEEKNNKIVIAEVNGRKIYKEAFLEEWERALLYNGGSIPEEQQDTLKESILDSLIQQELIMQKAKDAGFEVTDEIMEEARKDFEKEIEDYARDLQADAKAKEEEEKNKETEGETGSEEGTGADTDKTPADTAPETKADETAGAETEATAQDDTEDGTADDNGTAADNGTAEDETAAEEPLEQKYIDQAKDGYKEWFEMMKLTEEEYIEMIAKSKVVENFKKDQTKDQTVEENEVKDFYENALKEQRKYPSFLQYGPNYFQYPVVVLKTPESRTVKHILIKIPDEAKQEITKLRSDNKEADADKLLEEKLAEIEDKANEVLAKAKAGEDFEQLIETYGEDPGMKSDSYKDGYVVYKDGQFVKSFEDKAFELKKDEISDLVASDNGYHIIKLYDSAEEEVIPMEEVKDDINEAILTQKQNKKWDELVDGWMKKATIKKYKNRLKV